MQIRLQITTGALVEHYTFLFQHTLLFVVR